MTGRAIFRASTHGLEAPKHRYKHTKRRRSTLALMTSRHPGIDTST